MPSFYDLMKYAKTGIASPDMTGFDKLRARAAFGGYPVSTITGVPPISFKADGTPLISWSMLGNGQQTGTPTPDAPIMPEFVGVRTGNVMPSPTASTETKNGITFARDGNGKFTLHGTASEFTKFTFTVPEFTIPVSVGQGGGGTFSMFNSFATSSIMIEFYDEGTHVDYWSFSQINRTNTSYTVMGGKQCTRMILNVSTGVSVDGQFSLMFTDDGQLPSEFEPYGWKVPITNAGQTVPVYLGQVSTVRKIRKLVLTGEETYYDYTFSHEKSVYVSNVLDTNYTRAQGYCTHYPVYPETGNLSGTNYTTWIGVSSTQIFFIAACDVLSLENADAFKAWVAAQYAAGTPVTLWYVLATPQTAIVNEPLCKIGDYADELHSTDAGVTIPTVKGENTLTVDTDLQPSAVSVTGHIKSS